MELDDNRIEKLMQASVNMRDKIDELEKQITEIKVQRAKVDIALNEACRTLNVTSLKTKVGTLSRTLKTRYWSSDWPSMYDFILENKLPEFFEKRLVQSAIKESLTIKTTNTQPDNSINKVIFGGKKLFQLRNNLKITNQEFKEKKLSCLYSIGESGNKCIKGNRKFNLVKDLKSITFKPCKSLHIDLQLPKLKKKLKNILNQLFIYII